MTYRLLDLFSGIGGFSLGIERYTQEPSLKLVERLVKATQGRLRADDFFKPEVA
jgi:tRNA/tmRNA/rRNA uracil-C5-methylase (TrmA/RlmC/RlmD family)